MNRIRRNCSIILATVLLCFTWGCAGTVSSTSPAQKPASGQPVHHDMQPAPGSAKVYLGPDGIRVDMIRLQTPDRSDYLLRILGTRSKIDGLVLPCRLEFRSDNDILFYIRLDGEKCGLVRKKDNGQEMYLPERSNKAIQLTYDRQRSEALDPQEMITSHLSMKQDGTLAAVSRFDRPAEVAKEETKFKEYMKRPNERCGASIEGRIEFDTFSDDLIMKSSVGHQCGRLPDAVWSVCESKRASAIIRDKIRKIVCRRGDAHRVRLEGTTLVYDVNPGAQINSDQMTKWLYTMDNLVPGSTIKNEINWEKTILCTDGKDHFVGSKPFEDERRIVYGDGKTFTRMNSDGPFADSFFEPREFNPNGHRNFRGLDLRFYSEFEYDGKKGTCALRCGQREMPLQLLTPEQTRERLDKAKFQAPPVRRRPYALARDRKGIYYYVDVSDEQGARDFRVSRGPKGKLKQLDMKNVVLDSGGDVFVTREGTLRLVLEKENSFWIVRGKSSPLVNLQIVENLTTIYNELGIYLGVRLGTPCDIF